MMNFDEVCSFHDGFAAVKKNGKWSYIGRDGKLIAPLMYDKAEAFSEGYARVKRYGRWGFLRPDGKELSAGEGYDCMCGTDCLGEAFMGADVHLDKKTEES